MTDSRIDAEPATSLNAAERANRAQDAASLCNTLEHQILPPFCRGRERFLRKSRMHSSEKRSTSPRGAAGSVGQLPLDTFALIREAIVHRAQVWAILYGGPIHFCLHALGWRGEEAYVQALVLEAHRESIGEGGTRERLLRWQWLRLADLRIPVLRHGEWINCPRDQRPVTTFLTRVYCEVA